MKPRCRLGLHHWQNWTTIPTWWKDVKLAGWRQTTECELCGKYREGAYGVGAAR